MSEFFIQAIGYVGLLFFLVSYQIRSNRVLFLFQLLGCIIFSVQMALLGAFSGSLSLLVNILRNVLLLKVDSWKWVKNKLTLAAVIALLGLITLYTWAGPMSLLPFASVAISSIGYWTNNAQKIRLSQLFASPCTLVYDILIGSWGGACTEAMTLMSIVVSIFRFGWANLGEEK
ncbi:MAG: YgjV family protein [Oscillospiraceae bacterium]|nr:YgjV family protein [Oscillospiraceae bacterium]